MYVPAEQARAHDLWARRYLAAVLRRDTELMRVLLDEMRLHELWDVLDALGAAARDAFEALQSSDDAVEVLAAQLLRDALNEP